MKIGIWRKVGSFSGLSFTSLYGKRWNIDEVCLKNLAKKFVLKLLMIKQRK